MKVVEDILKDTSNKKIIIAIGSAQYSRTAQNPFTSAERKEMIRIAFKDAQIPEKAYDLIAISDIHSDSLWVGHVESASPKFDRVYTGNPLVKDLFQKAGYVVRDIQQHKNISSTKIRSMMTQGMEREWKKLVPNAVTYYLGDIGAEKIVKEITTQQSGRSVKEDTP